MPDIARLSGLFLFLELGCDARKRSSRRRFSGSTLHQRKRL